MAERMKWWGWGDEGVSFSHRDKPALGPFLQRHLSIDVERPASRPAGFDELSIPEPSLPAVLLAALEEAAGSERVSTDALDRLVHARGKSLRDLVRHRAGDVGRVPDASSIRLTKRRSRVCSKPRSTPTPSSSRSAGEPTSRAASRHSPEETRPVISVDLGALDRVLSVDAESRMARVQAGVLGPQLEEQLNARGWTLGHFPDSFAHSTLGGWIATRSSGMQSDLYGDVADLTRAVRVATPSGMMATRPVPSTSTGPSVREMVLGSEGRLGVITEATVHVHRLPEQRTILGYLFPTWADGLAAMRDMAASEAAPSVTRVSDAYETAFSFSTKQADSQLDRIKSKALSTYLTRRRHFDLEQMCLSFIGYEGTKRHVAAQRKLVGKIVSRHGGLCVGTSPGALYDQKKFDTPYIRDYLLDRGALADVSETSAPWSVLPALYDNVMAAARGSFADLGVPGYVMCHLSHSYHAGACLYFTFALTPSGTREPIDEYDVVKSAIQQTFIDSGATLSHHHAVGTEHARWLEEDISGPGVEMVRALLEGIDPGANLNPGKIVSSDGLRREVPGMAARGRG